MGYCEKGKSSAPDEDGSFTTRSGLVHASPDAPVACGADLVTAPEFGCVLFEAREEGAEIMPGYEMAEDGTWALR
jgi:hypothetical protein